MRAINQRLVLTTVMLLYSWAVGAATPIDTPTITPTYTATISPTPFISATITKTKTVTVTPTEVIINRVRLNRNRFNPLSGQEVTLLGLVPEHEQVTVNIYTQEGYLVKKLWQQPAAIDQVVTWDGKNESGSVVASGIYIFVISGKSLNKRLRLAVIK